jgi:hypothetical protein
MADVQPRPAATSLRVENPSTDIRTATSGPPRTLWRLAPVVGLLVLSPVAAEYLSGYQMFNPLVLLGYLGIFVPLYGTVAVLVREVTRRTGRGWPTILLLGAAFGLIQAGLIDQSLFNPGYLDSQDPAWAEAWREERQATRIPGLDVSASHLLGFVTGHMIMTFAAPIAVVEGAVPRLADRPWLGRAGLTAIGLLYLLGAVVVYVYDTSPRGFLAAPAQLVGTLVVAAALVAVGLALPRRGAATTSAKPAPTPWLVGVATLVLFAIPGHAPMTWAGLAISAAALGLLGWLLLSWSRRAGWGRLHVLLAAAGPMIATVVPSFLVADPLGDASPLERYLGNSILLAGVVAVLAWAWRRTRRAQVEDRRGLA